MMKIRILFLADTHLGFDLPSRPRIERRRRGYDFFDNFRRALLPAFRKEVDLVLHGGDVLYRSKVPAALVDMAFEPLRRLAESGVEVFVIPGNHERSRIPYPLFASHPGIHLFDRPRTYVFEKKGLKLALAGFPFVRQDVRKSFAQLVERTGHRNVRAHGRVLCIHQCVEGAKVGPDNFTFTFNSDVVRAADIPGDFAAVLSGHIHRSQALTRDQSGNLLGAPVLYPGSTERTSFAEREEKKGYLILELGPRNKNAGTGELILRGQEFRELPARPMRIVELEGGGKSRDSLETELRESLSKLPGDCVVKIRIHGRLEGAAVEVVRAASLRRLAAPTMNISLSLVDHRHPVLTDDPTSG